MNYPVTTSSSGDITVVASGLYSGTGALDAAGSVSLESTGNDVAVNAGVSAGAGGILFKASRDVLVDSTTKTISTTGGGDIVFWANASATGGEVDTGGLNVTINSNGGDIVIGGGDDDGANDGLALDGKPDNFLLGRTANDIARLGANMNSGAGDITVRSQASDDASSGVTSAIWVEPSVQISATTGQILLHGIQNSGNDSSGNTYGVILGYSSDLNQQAVITSTLGDVVIHGDASQRAASTKRRGVLLYGVRISAGGDFDIFG
jgi:hypothetical protein